MNSLKFICDLCHFSHILSCDYVTTIMALDDSQEVKSSKFWFAVAAEYLGMMFFVLFGTASTLQSGWGVSLSLDLVRIALTFGLGITLMVVVSVSGSLLRAS